MVLGLFQRKQNRWAIEKLHHSIVNQSLRPDFYFEGGVRDNFSGRFEMTSLHAVLLFRRLREAGTTGKELAQEVTNALFDGFDEALRDIGTGDLSVGKKIRKMGEAYYGRAKAYDDAVGPEGSDAALEEALVRNLSLDPAQGPRFRGYVRLIEHTLQRHENPQLLSGEVNWPKLPLPERAAS
ncbi:MAG TPA: ubiquinol-cytochrome C chaperone family protein [Hyphomonadaceae bacterium]|jgi:cytochrome b pre-mRNA-processing protein 3|nr:ubiquinol-cytochrome C chaperone family protein [Hyphomonadaceae bacterium]